MSTNIEFVFQHALLADAAYVTFNEDGFVSGDNWNSADPLGVVIESDAWDSSQGTSFKDRGFTEEQFNSFKDRYRVVYHQPDVILSGFSATVFYDLVLQKYEVAFRGTNGLFDLAEDVALALGHSWLRGPFCQRGEAVDFLENAGLIDSEENAVPFLFKDVRMNVQTLKPFKNTPVSLFDDAQNTNILKHIRPSPLAGVFL